MTEQKNFNFEDLHGNRINLINLKKITKSILPDMHVWSTNPKFFNYLEFPASKNIEDTKQQLDKMISRMNKGEHYWCIQLKDQEKIIGTIRITDIDVRKKICCLGYGLNPEFQGKGYGFESVKLAMDFLFKSLKIHKLTGYANPLNFPSIMLAEKMGYEREGLLRDHYLDYKGDRTDAIVFGLLREEYLQLKD
ncbi:MAG: GNAT family N-acetyltransferase [Candidatus Nitrosopumilus sp. bin_7KS]